MRKAFVAALTTLSLLGLAVAQEPFALSQGVIEKVDHDALRLRLAGEGQSGRIIDLKLDRHSRLLSVPAARAERAEAQGPRTVSWKSLRPGQFVAVAGARFVY